MWCWWTSSRWYGSGVSDDGTCSALSNRASPPGKSEVSLFSSSVGFTCALSFRHRGLRIYYAESVGQPQPGASGFVVTYILRRDVPARRTPEGACQPAANPSVSDTQRLLPQ